MSTTLARKTTCNGCGYTLTTFTSYYLDRKLWQSNHTLASCSDRKNEQAISEMVDRFLQGHA